MGGNDPPTRRPERPRPGVDHPNLERLATDVADQPGSEDGDPHAVADADGKVERIECVESDRTGSVRVKVSFLADDDAIGADVSNSRMQQKVEGRDVRCKLCLLQLLFGRTEAGDVSHASELTSQSPPTRQLDAHILLPPSALSQYCELGRVVIKAKGAEDLGSPHLLLLSRCEGRRVGGGGPLVDDGLDQTIDDGALASS
jgi:hypothetical protein